MTELEKAIELLPKDEDGAVRYEDLELYFKLKEEAENGLRFNKK